MAAILGDDCNDICHNLAGRIDRETSIRSHSKVNSDWVVKRFTFKTKAQELAEVERLEVLPNLKKKEPTEGPHELASES